MFRYIHLNVSTVLLSKLLLSHNTHRRIKIEQPRPMLKFCSSNRSAKTRRLEASNRKITKGIVIEKEKEREREGGSYYNRDKENGRYGNQVLIQRQLLVS